jgi:hypothetical protein
MRNATGAATLGLGPRPQFLCYPVLLHNSPNQKFLVVRETNSIIVIERAKRTRLDDDWDWNPGGGATIDGPEVPEGERNFTAFAP